MMAELHPTDTTTASPYNKVRAAATRVLAAATNYSAKATAVSTAEAADDPTCGAGDWATDFDADDDVLAAVDAADAEAKRVVALNIGENQKYLELTRARPGYLSGVIGQDIKGLPLPAPTMLDADIMAAFKTTALPVIKSLKAAAEQGDAIAAAKKELAEAKAELEAAQKEYRSAMAEYYARAVDKLLNHDDELTNYKATLKAAVLAEATRREAEITAARAAFA